MKIPQKPATKISPRKIHSAMDLVYVFLSVIFLNSCDINKTSEIPSILLSALKSDRPVILFSSPAENTANTDTNIPVFVWFDREMDREITQSAFSLTGSHPTPGKYLWEGSKLSYILDNPLTAGGNYVLTVSGNAASASGIKMDREYIVHFVAGPYSDAPVVLSTIPANNATNVNASQPIEISFSRAMNQTSVESAFTLSPSLAGSFSWNASSTVMTYTPYSTFSNATNYTVSIGTQAADTAGVSLTGVFNLTFQVGSDFTPPSITNIFEAGNPTALAPGITGISKDSSFEINFSEGMDYASTSSCVSLRRIFDGSTVKVTNSWNNTFTRLTVNPDSPLEPENEYGIIVNSCAKDIALNNLQNMSYINFFIGNSGSLLNSNYMKINSVTQVDSNPNVVISTDASQPPTQVIQNAGSIEIDVYFTHDLAISSLPQNIFLTRTIDVSPYSAPGEITSVTQGLLAGLPDNALKIKINNLEVNDEYVLEFSGGRNGILSVENILETSTWMTDSIKAYIKIK